MRESNIDHKDDVLRRFNDFAHTPSSGGVSLRFIEFFTGYYAVLHLALEKKIPIVVALKRFIHDDRGYSLQGVKTLYYESDGTKYIHSPDSVERDRPSITIEMYSSLSHDPQESESNPSKLHFVHKPEFDQFWRGFAEASLEDWILAIAATHPQYGKTAFVKHNLERLPSPQMERSDRISELYHHYLVQGTMDRLGTHKYFKEDTHLKSIRFTETIPLNTMHVYVSTYGETAKEQENLLKNSKDIVMNSEWVHGEGNKNHPGPTIPGHGLPLLLPKHPRALHPHFNSHPVSLLTHQLDEIRLVKEE